jgi:hypothetical protein
MIRGFIFVGIFMATWAHPVLEGMMDDSSSSEVSLESDEVRFLYLILHIKNFTFYRGFVSL